MLKNHFLIKTKNKQRQTDKCQLWYRRASKRFVEIMYSVEAFKTEVRRHPFDPQLHFQHANACCTCCSMTIAYKTQSSHEKTDQAKCLDNPLLGWVNGLFCSLLSYSDTVIQFKKREKHPRKSVIFSKVFSKLY